jgi:hypothetical protein
MAAMACAADAENAVGAGEVAPGDHGAVRVGGRQATTSAQPATLPGTIVMIGADNSGKRPPGT